MADSGVVVALALLWVTVLGLGILVLAALRHLAFLYERLEPVLRLSTNAYALHLNEPLPTATFRQPGTGDLRLADFAERRLFVLVVQTSCSACHGILRLARSELNSAQGMGLRPVVVVAGDEKTAVRLQQEHRLDGVTFVADPSRAASSVWGITSTPAAFVVEGGVVRKILPTVTADQVRRTLATESGAQAPLRITLPTLPILDSKQPTGGER